VDRWVNDLDLAVELVNTVYALDDPPDRLTSTGVYRDILAGVGQSQLAGELEDSDLGRLRGLRERLRAVFHAHTAQQAAALVNALLREAAAVPQLTAGPDGNLRLAWDLGRHGYDALAARLPGALASQIAAHGISRLGICAASPCTCVFVDRSRPGTRKYCCDQCNDRVAAAAYYHRKRSAGTLLLAGLRTAHFRQPARGVDISAPCRDGSACGLLPVPRRAAVLCLPAVVISRTLRLTAAR
jgi:predicted RNA-binding Zn ribbon-like protein